MVDTGTGFTGVKRSHGLWTNKVLLGGSAYDQTAGAVVEMAVSGTQATHWVNGTISGVNITATGSLLAQTQQFNNTGSPFAGGIVYPFTTRAVCSGGTWVNLSGNALAMGSPQIVAAPAIGVALATAGSNSTVQTLVYGVYPMIAEGTILAGAPVKHGVGALMNTVLDAGSPSFGVVGQALNGVGSEGTCLVFVGKGTSH